MHRRTPPLPSSFRRTLLLCRTCWSWADAAASSRIFGGLGAMPFGLRVPDQFLRVIGDPAQRVSTYTYADASNRLASVAVTQDLRGAVSGRLLDDGGCPHCDEEALKP